MKLLLLVSLAGLLLVGTLGWSNAADSALASAADLSRQISFDGGRLEPHGPIALKVDEPTPTRTPSPGPTATPTPTNTPTMTPTTPQGGSLIIHKRVWDSKREAWKPATPAHGWRFAVTNDKGVVVANPTDLDNTKLEGSPSYVVTEVVPAGFELYDIVVSTSGGATCPDSPVGGNRSATITSVDLRNGSVHVCAYNRESASAPPTSTPKPSGQPGITKEFFEQTNEFIVWKLSPKTDADYVLWDEFATLCEERDGAACGDIPNGGYGKFYAHTPGQYLLVSQPYTVKEGTCEVENHAKWTSGEKDGEVEATFRCSGATVLGWPLLAVVFIAATGIAYTAHRSRRWKR